MPSRRRVVAALFARTAAASIADAARADAELASLYDQVVAATARTNEAGISRCQGRLEAATSVSEAASFLRARQRVT